MWVQYSLYFLVMASTSRSWGKYLLLCSATNCSVLRIRAQLGFCQPRVLWEHYNSEAPPPPANAVHAVNGSGPRNDSQADTENGWMNGSEQWGWLQALSGLNSFCWIFRFLSIQSAPTLSQLIVLKPMAPCSWPHLAPITALRIITDSWRQWKLVYCKGLHFESWTCFFSSVSFCFFGSQSTFWAEDMANKMIFRIFLWMWTKKHIGK